jgi:hypothetical protein
MGIGQLIARIDDKWDTRNEVRALIGRRVPELRRRAMRTNELLLTLLRRVPESDARHAASSVA